MLDAIRGVAVLQVVAWHIITPLAQTHVPVIGAALNLTWTGVDLFFILSGYLLGGIVIRNRDSDNFYSAFYGRRVLRILPLYWLCLALYFLIVRPQDSIWPYLTFTQNFLWSAQNNFGPGFIAPTWSLAVEEQFYLVLPFLVRTVSPRKLPYVLVALIAAAPLCRIAAVLSGHPFAAYMLMPCRMDALFLGVLIAWATGAPQGQDFLLRHRTIVGALGAVTGCLLVVALVLKLDSLSAPMATAGYTVVALFYGSIVSLCLRYRLPTALTPLAWAGLGAYSLYLFHTPFQLEGYALFGPHPVALAFMVAGLAVTALLCWKIVEAPLIAFGHARFSYIRKPS